MAISSFDNRRSYAGDGSTTVFAFPPPFIANTDLVVQSKAPDGYVTTLALAIDYTVSGAGDPNGGTVTMTTAPANGTILLIDRDVPILQPVTLQDGGPLPAGAVNRMFDRITMWGQRLRELIPDVLGYANQALLAAAQALASQGEAAASATQAANSAVESEASANQASADAANAGAAQTASLEAASRAEAAQLAISTQTAIAIDSGRGLLVSFITRLRQRTWLEARDTDGGPSDYSLKRLAGRLKEGFGLPAISYLPGKLLVATDSAGRLTDLDLRRSDGKFSDRVINGMAPRLVSPMTPALAPSLGPVIGPYIPEIPHLPTGYSVPVIKSTPGKLLVATDSLARLTDLDLRRSDGKFSDRVINGMAPRLGAIIGPYITALAPTPDPTANIVPTPASNYALPASARYVRGNEVLPMLAFNGEISAWGASNIRHWWQQLAALGTHYGVSTYQGGCDSDTPAYMAARMGQTPMPISVTGGVIPAYGASDVAWTSSDATAYPDSLRFQNASPYNVQGFYNRNFTGWVNGVYCYLWIDITSVPGSKLWKPHRLPAASSPIPAVADATAVSVSGLVPFYPEDGPKHRNDISILAPGNNGINANLGVADTVNCIDNCFNWLSALDKRVLVHTHYIWPGMGHVSDVAAVNAHIAWKYGNAGLMIDVNGLVLSPAIWSNPRITAAGITPTAADTANQAAGICPASLLSGDVVHFSDATNNALLDLTIAKIDALGWVPYNPSPINH